MSHDNDEPKLKTCRECYCGYLPTPKDDGFCSDTCMKQYDDAITAERLGERRLNDE